MTERSFPQADSPLPVYAVLLLKPGGKRPFRYFHVPPYQKGVELLAASLLEWILRMAPEWRVAEAMQVRTAIPCRPVGKEHIWVLVDIRLGLEDKSIAAEEEDSVNNKVRLHTPSEAGMKRHGRPVLVSLTAALLIVMAEGMETAVVGNKAPKKAGLSSFAHSYGQAADSEMVVHPEHQELAAALQVIQCQ